MGVIISRFKKKKTTFEILEKLEKEIVTIEEYRMNAQQRQRHIVGQLIIYSVGLYVIAAGIFFYTFPSSLKQQILWATPLLLFPLLVILLKKFVTFYYSRKITRNERMLGTLKSEKKKLLDDVMDNETFKVARTILEKFAPEQLRLKGMEIGRVGDRMTPRPLVPLNSPASIRRDGASMPGTELRRRTLPSNMPLATPVPSQSLSSSTLIRQGSTPAIPGVQFIPGTPMHRGSINGQGFGPPGPPLPRPVLPRDRSYLDRVVEYLVGDGPANRYALICKSCQSHNGMALPEDFEYLSFRCCYCHYFNPARKQRPQAPRLTPTPISSGHQLAGPGGQTENPQDEDTSDSEKNSHSDSSDEDSILEESAVQDEGAKTDEDKNQEDSSQLKQDVKQDKKGKDKVKTSDESRPTEKQEL